MRAQRHASSPPVATGSGSGADANADANVYASSSSFSSPRAVPSPSAGTRRSPTHRYSVSPGSNGTRHFAAAAPGVEDEEVGGIGEAFPGKWTRAKPLARRLVDVVGAGDGSVGRDGRARAGAGGVDDAFDSAYDKSGPSSTTHSGYTSDDGEGGAGGGGKNDSAAGGAAPARFEPAAAGTAARLGAFSGGGGAFGAYRAAEATTTSREVRGEGSRTQKSVLTMSLRREAERR